MTQQLIDNTTGAGDTLKAGSDKVNANFTELYRQTAINRDPRVGAFINDVKQGYSTNLLVNSDSKLYGLDGGTAGSAINRLADDLVSIAPVGASAPMIYQIDFDITNRRMLPRRMIQVGNPSYRKFSADTTGGLGGYGNVANVLPGSQMIDTTNDMRIRFNIRPATDLPAAQEIIATRNGGGGARGWQITRSTTGAFTFTWYAAVDAATNTSVTVTPDQLSAAGFPIVVNQWNSLELYIDVDNGNGGYTVTWAAGAPFTDNFTVISAATVTTTTGVTTIAQPPQGLYLGGNSGNPAPSIFTGDIEQFWIFDAFWKLLTPPDLESWSSAGGLPDDRGYGGQGTIRIFNMAFPGTQPSSWLNDQQSAFRSNIRYGLGIISTADNQNESRWDTILAALQTYYATISKSDAPFQWTVALLNNNLPGVAAGTHGPKTQGRKVSVSRKFAALNDLPILDVESAFSNLSDNGASLIKADKQHPTNNSRTVNGGDGQEFILRHLKAWLGF